MTATLGEPFINEPAVRAQRILHAPEIDHPQARARGQRPAICGRWSFDFADLDEDVTCSDCLHVLLARETLEL